MSVTATILKRPALPMTSAATALPKVTKNKLLTAQPPTYYGCKHIGLIFQQDPERCKTSKNLYSSATRVALDPDRLTAQNCAKCSYVLTRTYLCIECPTIHCAEDAQHHFSETGHTFGVDSRNGHVLCLMCQDYIYDPVLEEIRVEHEASIDVSRKRRRLEDPKPSADDLKYIELHTSLAPCRTTGLRGFLNLGSTCFMSVVLQSLIHNPLVRNFYLSDGHRQKECTQSNCMSCAMDEVFSEFFTSDKSEGFGPVNLLTTSWKCDQARAGYSQQDAHEFLQFLLNQLHLTNKGTEQKTEDCSCIIHRSFYGRLQSDVTCEACRNVTTVYDPVMDLSLDLRIKDKKLAIPGNDGTVQTVEQCLSRFTATERLGINEYNCSKCSGPREATKQLTINRLPPVLCIQLKRFEHSANGSSKIDINIRFPLELDMTPFTTRAKRKAKVNGDSVSSKSRTYIYDLINVVVHKGEINSGHYISYCRDNGQWFQFDDSMVTLATEKQVLAAQAYLLVYIIRKLN